MAFTETWLTKQDQDGDLSIDDFGEPFRLDRDTDATGKTQGGGVCLYVNTCYCKSVTVRKRICTSDVELLSVCPFHLPREFPQICITILYIHLKANAAAAYFTVQNVIQKLQCISPDAPNFIMGDFNHVSLKKTLNNF